MKSYRLNSVEVSSSGLLPVLIACDQSEADGVAIHVASPEEAEKLGRVRVINSRALSLFLSNPEKFEMEYGRVSVADRKQLYGLLLLLRALRTKDQHTLTLATKRLVEGTFSDLQRRALENQPGIELAQRLAEGIRGVEFVLWWKDDGKDLLQLSGLRCPDAKTALYTLAVLQIEGGRGLGACVVCGQPFIRQRGTRKTCSGRCRYALFTERKRMRVRRRKS